MVPLLAIVLQGPRIVLPAGNSDLLQGFYGSPKDEGYEQSVLGRGAKSGVDDLRKRLLQRGQSELRLWNGFGPTMTSAYVFVFDGRGWTATKLLPALPWYQKRRYRIDLPAPTAGWKSFWRRLELLGVWTLPDMHDIPPRPRSESDPKGLGHIMLDGSAYFVETQRRGVYRAYSYTNPEEASSPQACRFVEINRFVGSQFPPDPEWPKDWRKRAGLEEEPIRHRDGGDSTIKIPGG